jgi:hypothetical protein
MTKKSALSSRASSLVEPELPLRAYFLSVGGALLLLLLAANWALPAPLPGQLTDSHSALPPIRIHSDVKRPEAVIIDTSRFGLRPTVAAHDVAEAPSQLAETEVADAAVGVTDNSPAATTDLRLRESLAQLQPAVHDQAVRDARRGDISAGQRELAQARPGKRRQSAQHSDKASFGGCVPRSRERAPCRYTLAPN